MDLSLESFLMIVGPVVLFSTVLQSMVGFGAGLAGIPALLMAGIPVQQAVALILTISLLQAFFGTFSLRTHMDWSATVRPTLIRLLTLPVGNLLLFSLHGMGQTQVKQMVGLILLGIVVTHWLWRVQPAEQVHVAWEWVAFGLSGLLLGFCGMGGPPIALWVMAHRWTAEKSRAFLFSLLFSGVIPQLLILWWIYGSMVGWGFVLGLAALPWALVGTYIGLRIGRNIDRRRWKRIALVFLE